MDLVAMSNRERFEWMRKRHAFLYDIVSSYTSIDKFVKDKEHWFALLGMDLGLRNGYAYIDMWLDYGEYELYFVIPGKDGHLTVSEVISWQDGACANTHLNIFSLHGAEESDILTSIHDYGAENISDFYNLKKIKSYCHEI